MKISKRLTKGCAVALAFLLTVPFAGRINTQAANGIDTEKNDCSITVSVEQEGYEGGYGRDGIPVALYKVADVNVSGSFTAIDTFADMDFNSVGEASGSEITADEWRRLSEEAAMHLKGVVPVDQKNVVPGVSGGASAKFTGLSTGLYLIVPAESYNDDYSVKYMFTPYLTALPSSEYALTGAGSDTWVYDTTAGLKMESEQQYGKLNIRKTLADYNESLGQTSFVFQVEGRDEHDTLVYSNVISTTHTGAGEVTAVLDKVPAGLKVTVKEVYSGASYQIDGDDTITADIVSDAAVEAGAGDEASVSFTNRYGGGNRGGYGVTNQFDKDGNNNWQWTQAAD